MFFWVVFGGWRRRIALGISGLQVRLSREGLLCGLWEEKRLELRGLCRGLFDKGRRRLWVRGRWRGSRLLLLLLLLLQKFAEEVVILLRLVFPG